MNKPLDELYLTWLYSQVGSVDSTNPSRNYWELLRLLYTKEFVWIIPNDDNRAKDGLDLRREFVDQENVNVDRGWMLMPCSMLELLIVLSRELSFQTEREPFDWFWYLIETLKLEVYNDNTRIPERKVDGILNRVIWRTYNRNGSGGLFPLRRATEDQRDVELWYQLNAYLLEKS